ncbi:hypothetical protein Patl1_27262 [Pistacia atlantica]|uniref:Uncharacterized protein n=1 Tax=Pistacia atlantica TaxID=434234 RepID=A0ACC1BC53_9ROSI|nr:hypothetical protein Patl1_27262 [Pistacia atlantica]
MKSETLTLILMNLAGIMERADESLLLGLYKEPPDIIELMSLLLELFSRLQPPFLLPFQVLSFRWVDLEFSVKLTWFSCLWENFRNHCEVAVLRGLNGICLAIVTTIIQSLVADSTDGSNRGMAFGWL